MSEAAPTVPPAMHLETERLLVRPWLQDEAPRLLDILSRLEVVKWLDDGPPKLMKSLDEAHERISAYHRRSEVPPRGFWAIEVRETGVVAGSVALVNVPDAEHDEVEIGWHLHPDSWGHGYASEAARAVLGFGLAGGLPEIIALTNLDNYPSQAVCRRIGMRDDGVTEKWYPEPSRIYRAVAGEYT
jgi:RimJ/RimL family protein N-acetyltransferase